MQNDDAEIKTVQHRGEERSNELRRRSAQVEPRALRTFTPSLAVIDRSAGSYHWTPEGRMLADFSSGVLVANLGHNPTRWWLRTLEYLGLKNLHDGAPFHPAAPLTAYNAVTDLEVRASERLIACLQAEPGGARCQQVLWAASGSEAIQKALWAALDRRPGADVILATRHGFHGKKGLAGAVTGCETDPERDARVQFISFPLEECESVERRMGPIDLAPYAAELDAIAKKRQGKIACLITEPYLGGGGSYHPQKEYLQLLQQFCREHDALLILDEVQANFGRTGSMFAFTTYGVEPDIVVLGKGLGNGVPVSAAVGRADVFAAMHYGEGSDTWSANPLACAAVLATLDEFHAHDVLGNARKLSVRVEEGLTRLVELPAIAHVRGEGMVWGVECAPVGKHAANEVAAAIVEACYLGNSMGLAIHLLGPLAGKVLRVSPPLVMPLDEASTYLHAMHEIIQTVGQRLAAD
ncbi:MAG TPA: aspartate aminotransferase family protein [Pirellulales bacterium]|jgi:4-aminobutyrate aminotransferase-like enzyme